MKLFKMGIAELMRFIEFLYPSLLFISLFFIFMTPSASAQDFSVLSSTDIGAITVMEVSGAENGNYNVNFSDGTFNSVPRNRIAKKFFETHEDEYDMLVIFTNFDYNMPSPSAKAFFSPIRNSIQGIGLDANMNYTLPGSSYPDLAATQKVQGLIEMGNLSTVVSDPIDPGFETTLMRLTHEMMHRWGAYIKYKLDPNDPNSPVSEALLGKDNTHWSYLLDTNGSVLYGNHWQDNGDGTGPFTSIEPDNHTTSGIGRIYSPLDLYLMGFIDKTQVPPMLLIENAAIDKTQLTKVGDTISGTATTVTIDQIIAAMGERNPTAAQTSKTLRTGFIYAVTQGTYNSVDLLGIEAIQKAMMTRFMVLTDGKGAMDVAPSPEDPELPTNPGVYPPTGIPRTLPFAINDGVAWLMGKQQVDGRWEDLSYTALRDTAESALALKDFITAQQSRQKGVNWLAAASQGNIDYLARSIEALTDTGQNAAALVDDLVSCRNADGGWGSKKEYASNPLDTALALKALATAGYSDQTVLSNAITYLTSTQNADGGWSAGTDTANTIQPTAAVLSAFKPYRSSHQLDAAITAGASWLMEKQNADGGFGNSPSTVYDTAVAVRALWDSGASTSVINNGITYLRTAQSASGSWSESVYQTALAARALWDLQTEPDLSIKSDDIAFNPSLLTSFPSDVVVSASVWNFSKIDVPQAVVALFEGDPALGNKVAEQAVSFPKQSATLVSFRITVNDSLEHTYFVSVDPQNQIEETDELNNIASKTLKVLQPPVVGFDTSSSGGDESIGSVSLAVSLSNTWKEPVTVKYAVNGAAGSAGPSDHALSAGALTFNPGETTKTIALTINEDLIHEPNETVVVVLYGPTNAALGVSRYTYTILDDDPVLVALASPSAGITADNTPLLNYTQTGGTVTVYLNGQTMSPQPQNNQELPVLPDGTHTIRVEATDTAGHFMTDEVTFTVDTTAPTVRILSPMAGTIPDNTPLLSLAVDDAQATVTVTVKVDGFIVSKVSGDSLDFLQDGVHTVRVEATDAAGNTGSAETSFVVNGPAPSEPASTQDWTRRLPDFSSRSVVVDEENIISVVGKNSMAKYDKTGGLIATSPFVTEIIFGDADTVAADSCGNVYAVGTTSLDAWNTDDMKITKIDKFGAIGWGGSIEWGSPQPNDRANSIAVDPLGNVFVTGKSAGYLNNWDANYYEHVFLSKFDGASIAGIRMDWNFRGTEGDKIAADTAGNVFLSGINSSYYLYDSGGHQVWAKPSGGDMDLQGNLISAATINDKAWLQKKDRSGNLIWSREISNDPNVSLMVNDIALDKKGNIYVVGDIWNVTSSPAVTDVYLAKFDGRGNKLWSSRIGSDQEWEYGNGIAIDDFGDLYVNAYGKFDASGTYGTFLIKFLKSAPDAVSTTTTYYINSSACGQSYNSGPVVAKLETSKGTCTSSNSVRMRFSDGPTAMLVAYLQNGGYAVDTKVTGSLSGSFLSLLSQSQTGGTGTIELVEANPSNGAVVSTLKTVTVSLASNALGYIGDLSALYGTVRSGYTFGIRLSMTSNSRDYNEIKWGQAYNCAPGTLSVLICFLSFYLPFLCRKPDTCLNLNRIATTTSPPIGT